MLKNAKTKNPAGETHYCYKTNNLHNNLLTTHKAPVVIYIYIYKHERRTIMKTLSTIAVSIFIVFFSFIFFICATQQQNFVAGDLV